MFVAMKPVLTLYKGSLWILQERNQTESCSFVVQVKCRDKPLEPQIEVLTRLNVQCSLSGPTSSVFSVFCVHELRHSNGLFTQKHIQ